jgi:hypothetical protein
MENGHVAYFTFAVTDVDKDTSDSTGSKAIVVPFDGVSFDADNGGAGGSGGAVGSSGTGGSGGRGGTGGSASGGTGGTGVDAGTGGAGGIPGTGGRGCTRERRSWRGSCRRRH